MSVFLDAFERADLRADLAATLPSTCTLSSVHATTGALTTVATAACRVVYPRTGEGPEFVGDQRVARVLLPPATVTTNVDVIAVTGGAKYRVIGQEPDRHDELLRAVSVIEARETGGPV